MKQFFWVIALSLLWGACNTPRVATLEDDGTITEMRQLDTMVITAPAIVEEEPMVEENYELPTYNPSHPIRNDLEHTILRLRFDWEKEQVMGQATLTLKPHFYPTNELVLDAKGFELKSITLQGGESLVHTYDGKEITITLPRVYQKGEEYTVNIDYVATPRADSGSDAISSDKGLFFINPRGEEGIKPQQIWTQGETEHNSRWFPTVDKPNQRCTQEMYVTVQDKYVTLSNGLLMSSTQNDDGTRTDYWKMDLPHAPYLFMLAIGEFAVVNDMWKGKPVDYYVEEEYEPDARAIFPHTPEMLGFFSDVLDLEYPWSKYSQVIVRDYVSGAMENTTGVIYGEFLQHTTRELIDELINDKIGAHELFHHWFGDYVTCESWANLTLQEGFANYSEYLWLEYKYGRDEADYHLLEEWGGYLSSAEDGMHDLIYYDYADKEDTFDAHSYNKGGAVLHMLRKIIGDEAFFASLNKYLKDNAFSEVEVAELRMAFEETTGLDMHWFFDQWYLASGHPVLTVNYDYDAEAQETVVTVTQTQEPTNNVPTIFQLFAYIDVYQDGQAAERHQVMVTEREQTFRFPASQEPALVIFDAEHAILAEWTDNKSASQLAYQLANAPRFFDRYQALAILSAIGYEEMESVTLQGLQDPFYAIRSLALESIDPANISPAIVEQIIKLANSDPHSEVRAYAIDLLAQADHPQALPIAKKALEARPYNVVASGLTAVAALAPEEGANIVGGLEGETNEDVVAAIGSIYASTADPTHIPYFQRQLENVDGFAAIDFYESFGDLLIISSEATLSENLTTIQTIGVDQGQSPWRRLAAISSLSHIKGELDVEPTAEVIQKIQAGIDAIKAAETIEQLRSIYQQF